jgi:quercetin dioxygenase-like cupin family protein
MSKENTLDVIRWNKKGKPTLGELTRMLEEQGLSWALYTDTPGTKYGRHKHDFDDVIVIVSGKMKLGVGRHHWLMEPGDRFDLPANTVHWAEVVGSDDVRYLSIEK